MEVIVIESEAYKQLITRIENIERLFIEAISELKEAKNDRYWSVEEVAEFTGFCESWVRKRKEHMGFFQEGKDLKFLKSNVLKYMSQRSVDPKVNRALKTSGRT